MAELLAFVINSRNVLSLSLVFSVLPEKYHKVFVSGKKLI
jgi:hypothetical protein